MRVTAGDVDLARGRIDRDDGATVQLTTTERALLAYLAGRPGVDVPRAELLSEVWGYAPHVSTRTLDTAVKVLRRKLEADPRRPDHVLTVWGVGYRFEPLPAPEDGDFVGRRTEVAAIRAALRQGVRVITLWGPAGVGKTRLVQEALATVQVTTVSLVGVVGSDLEEAVSLALPDPSGRPLERRLRRAPLVLVLDNAEPVADALRDAIPRWLAAAPGLQIVATTRVALDLPDEQRIEVRPLPPDAGAALFRRRLAEARRSAVDEPDASIAQVVDAFDALPLALEVAAGQGAVLGLDAIVRRGPAGLDRGHAVANVLRSSVALLDAEAARVLAACATFRGPFGAEELEEALPELPDVVGALQRLVAASLVRRLDGGELQVMAVIREVLPQLLARPDAEVRRRIAAVVVDRAERSLALARRWMRDLRAVFDAEDLPPALVARAGRRLVEAIGRETAADRSDAIRRVRSLAQDSGDPALIADAQLLVCAGALRNGRPRREDFDEAIVLSRAAGAPGRVAWALSHLGTLLRLQGDNEGAVAVLGEAEALAVAAGAPPERIGLILAERAVARRAGDRLGALGDLERALPFAVQCAEPRIEQVIRMRLGLTLAALGRTDAANVQFARSLELAERAGIDIARLEIRASQSMVALWAGDLDAAEAAIADCLAWADLGTAFHFGLLHAHASLLAVVRGDLRAGADHAARARAAAAADPGAVVAATVDLADGVWRLLASDPGAVPALERAASLEGEEVGTLARGLLALLPEAPAGALADAASRAERGGLHHLAAFARTLRDPDAPAVGLHARLVQQIRGSLRRVMDAP